MAFPKRRQKSAPDGPGVTGPVRHHRTLTELSGIRTGDIVIIDAKDLESEPAEALVERGVAAVINVSSTATGRFPNQGAHVLTAAGILLVDDVGEGIWNALRNGEVVRIEGGSIHREDDVVATGLVMTSERVQERHAEATSGFSNQLDAVVTNATDILRRDRAMLIEGERIPRLSNRVKSRPVIIVADGDAEADLRTLRRFIIDHDPVLVAAGGAADLILRLGYKVDVLIGDGDDMSPAAIAKADEIVLVSASGRWDRPERFEKHGRQPVLFTANGAIADLALLMIDEHEPGVIVLAGHPRALNDLVEREPVAVAGTFVARLRAQSRIVDAEAVSYFNRQRVGFLAPLLLLICGLIALVVAIATTTVGREWLAPLLDLLGVSASSIEGIFT